MCSFVEQRNRNIRWENLKTEDLRSTYLIGTTPFPVKSLWYVPKRGGQNSDKTYLQVKNTNSFYNYALKTQLFPSLNFSIKNLQDPRQSTSQNGDRLYK